MPSDAERFTLDALRPRVGQGVRIVVVDSGVHASHPHVGGVSGGVGVRADGSLSDEWSDRLGHGTAVTAVIREKAPAAELLVARVFDDRLESTCEALVAAIRWGIDAGAGIINLSLGTANPRHELALVPLVSAARQAGVWIVTAAPQAGVRWLPGALPGVVPVILDWTIPRDAADVVRSTDGQPMQASACGYPRPIPGVPPERNLRGVSFAVANATGILACLRES
ncbi:MAG: S8 family serine peptidase [Acidobacteria bacterium]|nr:S8 family serine peptidase [Acidobacteriota bacterium]